MLIGTEKKPKGPDFSAARKIEKNISGAKLSFLSPPHNDAFSNLNSWEEEADSLDTNDVNQFKPKKLPDDSSSREVSWSRVYSSTWEYRGLPIIQGYCGHMNLLVDVNKFHSLPVNENLLDSQVLAEQIYQHYRASILDDMHEGFSDDPKDVTTYHWPSSLGPINNQWVSRGGRDWFYFEDQPLVSNTEIVEWHTALDPKHSLVFRFVITRSAPNAGNPFQINKRISLESFTALMHKIMDTVNLETAPTLEEPASGQGNPNNSTKPVFTPSKEEVEEAKYVMWMWSARGYTNPDRNKESSHRANREEVSTFIDEKIKPRPLTDSYPLEETQHLSGPSIHPETKFQKACIK
ncbi:hypothetical protein [Microbulbifer celer]|uniref:Uncharacterized protein n=1 Tax=Microbulbifer celer TaxID=435905 RepID=A0ABW3U5Y7_9GAMM|nr:hypothetical protein [Microbulbifer celer]UFN56647.1 hypothetical protein LPW13_13880 [Microbulbifer celer]